MNEEAFVNPTKIIIEADILRLIPKHLAAKYTLIPLYKEGEVLHIAMENPNDLKALDAIRHAANLRAVIPHPAKREDIQAALDLHFSQINDVQDIVQEIHKERFKLGQVSAPTEQNLEAIAEQAPVIKLVNQFIFEAVQENASDIHLEPGEKEFLVRYRIDGILYEKHILKKELESAIIARIKIMSGMDIAERRKPQDGRIDVTMESKQIDIRVSALPTLYGENLVLRLLDKGSVKQSLEHLGMSGRDLKEFRRLIHYPHGILLATGPTGSGKSTTLYASLNEINSMDLNIVTVEDPIEYNLPLIRQMQVNPKIDLTFASGLRSILRQDPDVIMVGEIRDGETAEIAVQAALTGHLVLSTLHTNDAAGAITRLMDMGIQPYLIANSVVGILAQRLVRKICPHCKEPLKVPDNVLNELGIKDRAKQFYHGRGCEKCQKEGFIGRTAIHELMVITEEIGIEICKRSDLNVIRGIAVKNGMRSLREAGIERAMQGITTLDEVLEITAQE